MSSLQDLCDKYFGHRNLYDVLRIPKDADEKQVRKAYHRLSLLVHPDRVEEHKKAEATEKFKVLGKVHSILSDKEKRAIYDETGVYDEDDEAADRDWTEYWRLLFKKITVEDITNYEKSYKGVYDEDGDEAVEQDWTEYWRLLFKKITVEDISEKSYKGSQEEKDDLKRAYLDGKGDMDFILEAVPFSNTEEEGRLRELILKMIKNNEVPEYSAFVNETPRKRERRKRKWQKEAEEAERMRDEMGLDTQNDLKALIRSRQEARADQIGSFLDHLAEKYAPKKKDSGGRKKGGGKKSK